MDTHLAAIANLIVALGGLTMSATALLAVLKSRRAAEAAHTELTSTVVDKIESAAAQVVEHVDNQAPPPKAA